METKKAKVDVKPELVNLYQTVCDGFAKCEPILSMMKKQIEGCTDLKKTTKKEMLDHLHSIFAEANSMLDTLGDLGKIK